MTATAEKNMNLTTVPETVQWPETHYIFIEKIGPMQPNAQQAWSELHPRMAEIAQSHHVLGYLSLYDVDKQIYRAGAAVEAQPKEIPAGLRYERFAGGKYGKFVLTGPYSLLPEASGRVWAQVRELNLPLRRDFNIENYVNDPRTTPEEQLKTEILFPLA